MSHSLTYCVLTRKPRGAWQAEYVGDSVMSQIDVHIAARAEFPDCTVVSASRHSNGCFGIARIDGWGGGLTFHPQNGHYVSYSDLLKAIETFCKARVPHPQPEVASPHDDSALMQG